MKPRDIIESTLIPHTAFEHATQRLEQCFECAPGAREPICIAVIGESRTGKSRLIEEFEVDHPMTRTPEGLTLPVLRVKTPSTPTIKGLAEVLLDAIQDPRASAGTAFQKTKRLKTLMGEVGTVILMIDEFHHFYDRMSHKVLHPVTDWLKIMVDDTKVALVVAGLPSCRAVLMQNEQLAGRFLTPIAMPRFDWRDRDQREEFVAILAAFHESLTRFFDVPALDTPEMAFRCYCASGGLIGYLSKFLRQAVWNAVDARTKQINLGALMRAHAEAVWRSDGPDGSPSPFSRDFEIEPNEALLEKARALGARAVPLAPPRRHSRRQRNLAEILSAA